MQPIMEAAKIRMTERAVVITMAMMQLSMTLMLLHFDTMEKNKWRLNNYIVIGVKGRTIRKVMECVCVGGGGGGDFRATGIFFSYQPSLY